MKFGFGFSLVLAFSGIFYSQKYNHVDTEEKIVDNTIVSRKYGIKDDSGNWVLKPSYYYIEDFYDDELNVKDTVAIFQNSKFYKNSNIFLGNKYGLLDNNGKIVIPDIYDQLICSKGNCVATLDKKTFIIDYKSNRKEVFDGTAKYFKDSLLILEEKQGINFVRNLKFKTIDGPFYETKILNGKDVYFTANKEKSLHKLNGDLLVKSEDIFYQYDDNFFADNVYIAEKLNRKTFKNLNGKSFPSNFDRIIPEKGDIFSVCPETKSGGDYSYCPGAYILSIFEVLKGLGEIDDVNGRNISIMYNNEINFPESNYDPENIPPVNIIKKNNQYAFANSKGEIISKFYLVLKPSFAENEDSFYFEKKVNGKTVSGIIENGIETISTPYKVVDFYGNQLLVFNLDKNFYEIISKDKNILIKENIGGVKFVGKPFESRYYVLEISNSFFTLNEKGKLKITQFQRLSNFHKGFAFALNKKREILLINEKLKTIKTFSNLNYSRSNVEIDNNGNTIFEDKEDRHHQFIINYKGEIILDKTDTDIERSDDSFYKINNTLYYNGGYTFVDRNGKSFYEAIDDLANSRIFRKKNYVYVRVSFRSRPPDFYFFDNSGKFLGKNLPLYKQSLKGY
jgi:hypothetical protein